MSAVYLRIMGKKPDGRTPDDNQRWWIAGDPALTQQEHTAFASEQRGINRKSNVADGHEWAFTLPKDTKNESLTLSFSTTRLFDSALAAWRWCNSFSRLDPSEWAHPIEGDVVMRFQVGDGTWEEERLYNCLLSKPSIIRTGPTVELNYTLRGGRIEPYAVGEDAIPMSDAYAIDIPQAGLFLTSTGGAPVLNDAETWSDTTESLNGWWLKIQATDIRSSPQSLTVNFYFGLLADNTVIGATTLAPPMKNHLATIAAALDPTWFDAAVVTEGGRSMLRIKNIRSPEYVGQASPPLLTVEIRSWYPRSQALLLSNNNSGVLTLFTDVLPFDDGLETPVGDDDAG